MPRFGIKQGSKVSASGSSADSWSSMTVDEKKGFPQIAIHPDHRRISIIAVHGL